jgi:hypothetical protein
MTKTQIAAEAAADAKAYADWIKTEGEHARRAANAAAWAAAEDGEI